MFLANLVSPPGRFVWEPKPKEKGKEAERHLKIQKKILRFLEIQKKIHPIYFWGSQFILSKLQYRAYEKYSPSFLLLLESFCDSRKSNGERSECSTCTSAATEKEIYSISWVWINSTSHLTCIFSPRSFTKYLILWESITNAKCKVTSVKKKKKEEEQRKMKSGFGRVARLYCADEMRLIFSLFRVL
jgi:hypothetical protein